MKLDFFDLKKIKKPYLFRYDRMKLATLSRVTSAPHVSGRTPRRLGRHSSWPCSPGTWDSTPYWTT